ncbi:MAG: restriction endonuclease subunit S [Candidatus Onthomorpha sp.]|nr:restriction endonuclease subunit S [Bacteroidales bacterium]MDD7486035.1 restriction endonuclease subunit S [Bacteroidales bacterium]MDY5698868.1 restriction endonuclease subunit S [Candidatus Onthomorpha sp.]
MNTKTLRQKILDLAIHGKLVPQDPNDEPASELLKRIKAEKEEQIKEEKIKKSKKTKTTSDTPKSENPPFEIPSSWEWTTLGEIGVWQAGGTPNRMNMAYYGGTIPWLKTGDLNDGLITDIPEFITEEAVANSSAKLNPAGSVLIAMYGATIGKLGILSYPAATNQACCACIEYGVVEQLFLFYFLLSQRTAFIEKGGGGAQPNISKEIILHTSFPLPPLEEQKRIVAEIERWFALIDQIEQSKAALQSTIAQAKKKILDLAIHGKLVAQDPDDEPASELLKRIKAEKEQQIKEGKIKKSKKTKTTSVPFEIPSSWEWTTLGEISNYGCCENIPVAEIGENDWVLELEDIEKDTARIAQIRLKQDRDIKGVRHKFTNGDVLYSKLRTYLNKVLVAPHNGYCTTEIVPLHSYCNVSTYYLSHVLRSGYFLDYTQQCGYGVKMPRLSTNDACNGSIPLPPLAEQKRIVKKIEELFGVLDTIQQALGE